jgi:uncharacterized protein
MAIYILFFGILFGAVLRFAKLNKFDTISGLAVLKDLAVAKTMALAIGLGAIFISFEVGAGLSVYHIKPLLLGGIILGGLIFGSGMAILGYCPGTMAISLGEGSVDAFVGILGGLTSGLIYTLVLPSIKGILGPDLGAISLNSLVGEYTFLFYSLVVIIGLVLIYVAFVLQKIEKSKDIKWIIAGIALAVLNAVVLLKTMENRPMGASTFYPYFSDLISGNTENAYFEKIQKSGHWEMIFLSGAFLSGLILSLINKEFRLTLIHDNWKKYKGTAKGTRILWAFIGGFILVFGARMAGGCTSGHILSGGMQLSVSSFTFAIFTFAGLLLTGKFFYKTKNQFS